VGGARQRHRVRAAITRILAPTSRFAAANNHAAKKQTVLARLVAFFDRYFALV